MSRFCCDGQCVKGKRCPSFYDGVIEGPYRRSVRRKAEAQANADARGVGGFLRRLWAYLMGPRP